MTHQEGVAGHGAPVAGVGPLHQKNVLQGLLPHNALARVRVDQSIQRTEKLKVQVGIHPPDFVHEHVPESVCPLHRLRVAHKL